MATDGVSRPDIERAISGALRSAIRAHGPITPEHIGSAAKRIAGNLANVASTTAPLLPGEARAAPAEVLRCRCARCGHEWTAVGPGPPRACAACRSPAWRTLPGTVRRGRPPRPPR